VVAIFPNVCLWRRSLCSNLPGILTLKKCIELFSYASTAYVVASALACSRLRDSCEKSFNKKKCEKRAGAPIFLSATAPFPKSRASYFRFARFNTSALYYLRAWHRLHRPSFLFDCFVNISATCKNFLGKWFAAPPRQKIVRTPMVPCIPYILSGSPNESWLEAINTVQHFSRKPYTGNFYSNQYN